MPEFSYENMTESEIEEFFQAELEVFAPLEYDYYEYFDKIYPSSELIWQHANTEMEDTIRSVYAKSNIVVPSHEVTKIVMKELGTDRCLVLWFFLEPEFDQIFILAPA